MINIKTIANRSQAMTNQKKMEMIQILYLLLAQRQVLSKVQRRILHATAVARKDMLVQSAMIRTHDQSTNGQSVKWKYICKPRMR
jgi:hypothetical protein